MKYEKRCSQCNLVKSWSLFTYKNGDLLDICKECEMFNFLKKNSDNLSEEAQNLYIEAYVEGFNKSTSTLYYKKKDDANKYAKDMFPELGEAISESARRARYGTTDNSALAKVGDSLKAKLSRLRLREKYMSNNNTASNENGKKLDINLHELYKGWIDKNDFIVDDNMLVFFLQGTTTGAFSGARYRLKTDGYEFSKVENGWKVVKRPEVKKTEEESVLSDEEIKALEFLLGKIKRAKNASSA